jgi:hypothetical protein
MGLTVRAQTQTMMEARKTLRLVTISLLLAILAILGSMALGNQMRPGPFLVPLLALDHRIQADPCRYYGRGKATPIPN